MRGFTTIRDMGGPVFGLKRAIDDGIIVGPRIYPSGAFISQTSGHGDFRFLFELPRQPGGPLSHSEREGIAAIADSPDEVRLRAREQLRMGASQIKLMGGGGVSSPATTRSNSIQFTEAEMRAAVEAASDWGTYVTVHAYTPAAIQRAIRAGVKVIEHGQLADDETAKMMADNGIWWSLQPLGHDARHERHGCIVAAAGRAGVRGNRKCLSAGQEVQHQDRFRRRYPVRSGRGRRPGSYLAAGALDDARRSAEDGDGEQRRIDGAVGLHQSLSRQAGRGSRRARWPTFCWSTAIRWRTSIWSPTPTRTSRSS